MIVAKTDITRARAKLNALGGNVRGTLTGVLESEARICAISLAKSTQPFGTGSDAKIAGEKAVTRDISKVYFTAADVYSRLPRIGQGDARQFWALINMGKIDAARAILAKTNRFFGEIPIGTFDAGDLHRQSRSTSSGRVLRTKPGMIVTDSKRLEQYRKEKIALVGFAKSAWAAIARELGGIRGLRAPKLPAGADITANWITRKNGPHAIDRQYGDPSNPRIVLTSKVTYADHVLDSSAKRSAIAIAYDRLLRQLVIAARYEARAAMRMGAAA